MGHNSFFLDINFKIFSAVMSSIVSPINGKFTRLFVILKNFYTENLKTIYAAWKNLVFTWLNRCFWCVWVVLNNIFDLGPFPIDIQKLFRISVAFRAPTRHDGARAAGTKAQHAPQSDLDVLEFHVDFSKSPWPVCAGRVAAERAVFAILPARAANSDR